MHIRPASVEDAAAVARLTSELGYAARIDEMDTRLAVLLASDAHLVAVAEDAGQIRGWIAAEERLLLESGRRVEIVGLVVAASARRMGVGAELVGEVERWASRRGVQTIFVRSNVARIEAHPFYESLGYARVKTQHAYARRLPDQ